MELFSQGISIDRQPVAAGRFYTAEKETLKRDLAKLFAECTKPGEDMNTRAIIAPHAGYVFSGKIAASAFSSTGAPQLRQNLEFLGTGLPQEPQNI